MARFKMIALTRPMPGREEEYNRWYQTVHLPQVCALPGITGAQRYKQTAALANGDERPYLAIYDIETDDIGKTMAGFGEAAAAGRMTQCDASDNAGAYTVIFEEFGERVNSAK
ncbi:MAG: hypothetical protein KGK11_13745 [Sphingomonadales bacterium]|nr:hypothetical protein [Sphingomonadales bacterium]